MILSKIKNKAKIMLLLIVATTAMVSCGGKGSSDNDSLAADSMTLNGVTKAKNDSLVFKNSAAAMYYMKNSDNWGKYSKGILPRMASENLDYCTRLLNNKFDYFIVCDKRRMKVILFDKFGVEVKNYGMACARNFGNKHRRSDCRTSEGFFTAEGIYNSTDWLYTDDFGYTSPAKGVFGPRFIRVKIPGVSSIGIHGTTSRGSIGKRASHGCMRLLNEDVLDLAGYAKKGMPIVIIPGDNDQIINEREGGKTPTITTRLDGVDDAPKFAMRAPIYDSPRKIVNSPAKQDVTVEESSEENPASITPAQQESQPASAPVSAPENNSGE